MTAPRYKVGDFLVNHTSVFMLIVAVIEGDPCIYAISHIKQSDHLHWLSELEIADNGFRPGKPDFSSFENIKEGDIIGQGDDGYVKVLARVGHAVLLSQPPDEAAGLILDLTRNMKEAGIDVPMLKGAEDRLQNAASSHKAYRRAGNWHDVRTLALMNWRVIKDGQ